MIIVQLREFRVIIRLKPLGNESAVLLCILPRTYSALLFAQRLSKQAAEKIALVDEIDTPR